MGGFSFDPSNFYSDDPDEFAGFSPDDFADEGANRTRRRDPAKLYDNIGYSGEEIERLKDIASRPSPSAKMYEDFLESQPTREEFKPSLGRKLAATAIGALSGNPYGVAKNIVDSPFNQARQEWQDRKVLVGSQARSADTNFGRQQGIEKFGITQGAIERNRSAQLKRQEAADLARKQNQDEINKDRDATRKGVETDRELRRQELKTRQREAQTQRDIANDFREQGNRRAQNEATAKKEDRETKNNAKRVAEIKERVMGDLVNDPHLSSDFTINDQGQYIINPESTQEARQQILYFKNKRIKEALEAAGLQDIYDIGEP